jgi:hypothetical protein
LKNEAENPAVNEANDFIALGIVEEGGTRVLGWDELLLSVKAQIVRPLASPNIWSAFLRRTFSGGRGPWLTSMWRAWPPNHSGVIPAAQALATFIPIHGLISTD